MTERSTTEAADDTGTRLLQRDRLTQEAAITGDDEEVETLASQRGHVTAQTILLQPEVQLLRGNMARAKQVSAM